MNILDMDATSVAEKIKKRELTSSAVVQTYITHLERVNPDINCLVQDRFELAIREAEEIDRRLDEGKTLGKLAGVPISMKEAYDVAGMETTGGLAHRQDQTADSDAALVTKLKAEGAIILGKTNTPTLCFCQESENKLYGRTNNPWDVARSAGGSSGGEGALIAVGGAAAGVGSDIGGSIRFPSHFNGVVSFKSGNRQVSARGHFPPIDHPYQERMLGLGPMTKSVRDAERMYNIIAESPAVVQKDASWMISILPKTTYPLSSATEGLLSQLKEVLSEEFATEVTEPPFFNEASLMWQEIMSIDGAHNIAEIAFGERNVQPLREYLKERLTGKAELHRYLTWAILGAKMFKPSQKRIENIGESLEQGDAWLDQYLAQRVLIFPVYHRTAPPHGELYKELFSIRKTFLKYMPYIAYANVWGLPVLTIPVGTDGDGLPIAVQLIGRNGNEGILFQLGKIIEERFRGYVRCTEWDR